MALPPAPRARYPSLSWKEGGEDMRASWRVVAIGVVSGLISACGGGGGEDGPPPTATQVTAFFTDFDGAALAPEVSPGEAARAGVELFAGLGPAGNTFGGQFLRSPTANTVTLSLAGLPSHQSLDLAFLLAAIDSLDGTGTYPQGDFFRVDVDGTTVFRESFANATDGQVQSYVPPPGVELARKVDLGFQGPGGFYRDSAYDLGADPAFAAIPHTAATVTVTFVVEGPGIQPLTDESWAMDDLRVTLNR